MMLLSGTLDTGEWQEHLFYSHVEASHVILLQSAKSLTTCKKSSRGVRL